jgi:DNA-binding beta-propeller fold protein YncE
MDLRKNLICLLVAMLLGSATLPSARADEPGIQRYLVGSLHTLGDFHKKKGETFPDALEQGLFVYDIDNGHRLVKKFPAKMWTSWSGGWAGLAAHADSGVLFQVQDGSNIRAYDFPGEKLLWERGKDAGPGADHERQARAFQYIDRRLAVTKDGKHLLVPDRDSAKKDKDGKPVGLGVPVVRVLDAKTGKWVKNIPLGDPAVADKAKGRGWPHQVQAMRRYVYASQWEDGYVYCICPDKLEVVRRIGPVDMGQGNQPLDYTKLDALTRQEAREPPPGVRSIQHFSVDPAERYVYVEPIPAFGIGIIGVQSGRFLGQWPVPQPAADSLLARRQAIKGAQGNQLHSKRNHGIAARPNSTEVWMTDDNWGFLHVWDVATLPPKYVAAVPLFEDVKQPIYDFSWVNFSIDGKYCYASNKVIDAAIRKVVAKLNGLNEASIEIQVKDGKVVRTGHDGGSGLDTWIEGYDLPAN